MLLGAVRNGIFAESDVVFVLMLSDFLSGNSILELLWYVAVAR